MFRFEISIRDFNKVDNDFEAVINHIKTKLSLYRLFYFENKANCNKIKREYRDNIKKKRVENFSKSLEHKAFKLSAYEFKLTLSDGILGLIKSIFIKNDSLISIERKVPKWLKKIPSKKSLVKNRAKKSIVTNKIVYSNFNPKVYILKLQVNIIFYIFEIIQHTRGLYPINKAPP